MENNAPGRTLLKVTGILYIIISALLIVMALLVMAGGGLLAATGEGMGIALGAGAMILAVVSLVQGVFGLIMGIMGVKNCDKPEKAGSCLVMGVIVLVLGAIGLLGNLFGGADTTMIISGVLGLLIPVLYTWGAVQNKNAAKAG